MDYYQSEAEIEAVVVGFESCTMRAEDFKHRSHLTVAVWYLLHSSAEEAVQKMRSGLFRFLDHHGVGRAKYNETMTLFWIKLVENAIGQMNQEASTVEKTNKIIECLSDACMVFEYYSEAHLRSPEAVRAWEEPDLKQLRPTT
jgi:hypothetical protein